MNVLTDPNLFTDLQGNTPPQWAIPGGFLFGAGGSTAQALIYTGATFKLPTAMTVMGVTTAGANVPSLRVTVTSPTTGDVVSVLSFDADTGASRSFSLADDATGLRMEVESTAGPYADAVSLTLTPVSAVDRIYPPNQMGRNTTAYVSRYQRDRVHVTDAYAYEQTRLTADFNGLLSEGRVLASATWQTQYTASVFVSEPDLSPANAPRETSVLLSSQISGPQIVKCTATLDNGEKYVQQFRVNVLAQPFYVGDSWTTAGAQTVTVEA